MSFSHKCTLTDSPDCAKRPSHHIFERVSGRTLRGEPYGCYGAYSPNTVGPIMAVAPPSPPNRVSDTIESTPLIDNVPDILARTVSGGVFALYSHITY